MTVDALRTEAREWVALHRSDAPTDYGPILPPDLYEHGRTWQRALFAGGWAGLHWPAAHGGQGLSPEHNAAWIEECALAGVPPFINMVGIVLAGGALLRFGTPDQQERHLRSTLTADEVWCQLFSEPGAGSDLASLTTTATSDGDSYRVNGQKVWCSGGRYSDWGILLARTDPGAARHRGISFFLLDMHVPGVEVRALRQMTGEAEFDEVFLTDVVVPADCLLGPENEGWAVAMAVLTNERGHIGASVIGLERRLEALAAIGAGERLDALSRDRLASLLGRGYALKALGQRRGEGVSGSLMKLGITELLFDAAMLRGALSGATAVLEGAHARGMLAAPGGRIAGGTSQVQRTIIGERLLGLPREPKGEI